MNIGEALLQLHAPKPKPIIPPKKAAKPYAPRKTQAKWETEILSVLEKPMTVTEIQIELKCSRTPLRENLTNMFDHKILNRTSILCKGGRQFLYWRKAK